MLVDKLLSILYQVNCEYSAGGDFDPVEPGAIVTILFMVLLFVMMLIVVHLFMAILSVMIFII